MADMSKYTSGSNFYKAEHLEGKDLRLVVSHVDEENLARDGEKEDVKPILSFKGDDMRLPLNITNAKLMVKHLGKDSLGWSNNYVTLHPTTCEFGSDTVDCIRLKFPPDASLPAQPVADASPTATVTAQKKEVPF